MNQSDPESYLERVYGSDDSGDLADIYDGWAESYDHHLASLGYRHPAVVAGMVGRHIRPDGGTLLDAAAGTGLIGAALYPLGYTSLVAIDLSDGMLAAAAQKGVYQDCRKMTLGLPLAFADGEMRGVVAAGVFTPGHAPPASLDELCRITRQGGHIIATISQPAYEDGGFGAKIAQMVSDGCVILADESGDYVAMPASPTHKNATARVYVLEIT